MVANPKQNNSLKLNHCKLSQVTITFPHNINNELSKIESLLLYICLVVTVIYFNTYFATQ